MIDIKFLRENPEIVKENIKNAVEAVVNISAHRIQVFAK